MYGSDNPDQKHLYIFAINKDTEKPIVFYMDGETMYEGEYFIIKETANEELKSIFYALMIDEEDTYVQTAESSSDYITDWETFEQLSQEERQQYCTITPWYEIPDGFCSNKGMLPEGHWYFAREYGRKTGAGVDESIAATRKQFEHDPNYYDYLLNPEYYTEREGRKFPITAGTSDFNGNGILEEWEIKEAQSNHTY